MPGSEIQTIVKGLRRRFEGNGQRIVFWDDPGGEYAAELMDVGLELPDVEVIRTADKGAFEIKCRIELDAPQKRFLLYVPTEPPSPELDWLLDIRLYCGEPFRADRASMLVAELGLAEQKLRLFVGERKKFFANKDRVAKLKELVVATDLERELDLKMLAVATRAGNPDFFAVLRALTGQDEEAAEGPSPTLPQETDLAGWKELQTCDLTGVFWEYANEQFGYGEPNATLPKLLIRLFATDFLMRLPESARPEALAHLILPKRFQANVRACLAGWRDSQAFCASYMRLARAVAAELKIDDELAGMHADALMESDTFRAADYRVAGVLRDRLLEDTAGLSTEAVLKACERRLACFWARQDDGLRTLYAGLKHAANYLAAAGGAVKELEQSADAATLYRAYLERYSKLDQLHRWFNVCADTVEGRGWDVLKGLRERIEGLHANGYLTKLARVWGEAIDGNGGLLKQWRLPDVPNQFDFYERFVEPMLQDGDARRRVFVIVSDAFRYEAAEELCGQLNGRYRFVAELKSMLGVLPSCTDAGMAALLPHKKLTLNSAGAVCVDGKHLGTLEAKSGHLAAYKGVAVWADDLKAMKKDEGRAFVKDFSLVYVYHNVVDSRGDTAATEGETFQAVAEAIEEIGALVRYLIDSLNANNLLVTADHGFLFSPAERTASDKNPFSQRPVKMYKEKKRYCTGEGSFTDPDVWSAPLKVTADIDCGASCWLPRGTGLFHFVGGARYFHGGAMPQEVAVPVITVRHAKEGTRAEKTRVTKVGILLEGERHRITTEAYIFRFMQADAVSERVQALTARVGVYGEGGQAVTTVETVSFDSGSEDLNQRRKSVRLTLVGEGLTPDPKAKYRLRLFDAATDAIILEREVSIIRSFRHDF